MRLFHEEHAGWAAWMKKWHIISSIFSAAYFLKKREWVFFCPNGEGPETHLKKE
jgi:hypothetical protein